MDNDLNPKLVSQMEKILSSIESISKDISSLKESMDYVKAYIDKNDKKRSEILNKSEAVVNNIHGVFSSNTDIVSKLMSDLVQGYDSDDDTPAITQMQMVDISDEPRKTPFD